MTLKLLRVEDAGDLESERVVLQASSDTSIGKYIILQARTSPDGRIFSGAVPAAYWLASMSVKKGDFIVLYSKHDLQSKKQSNPDGPTSYFFCTGCDVGMEITNGGPKRPSRSRLLSVWLASPRAVVFGAFEDRAHGGEELLAVAKSSKQSGAPYS